MTQIASVLTATTVFVGLLTLIATFYSQRRRAYTRDKNTYARTFTKSAGGLMREGGGVFAGHYGTRVHSMCHTAVCIPICTTLGHFI